MSEYLYSYISENFKILTSGHKNGVNVYSSRNPKRPLKIQWIFVILFSLLS